MVRLECYPKTLILIYSSLQICLYSPKMVCHGDEWCAESWTWKISQWGAILIIIFRSIKQGCQYWGIQREYFIVENNSILMERNATLLKNNLPQLINLAKLCMLLNIMRSSHYRTRARIYLLIVSSKLCCIIPNLLVMHLYACTINLNTTLDLTSSSLRTKISCVRQPLESLIRGG